MQSRCGRLWRLAPHRVAHDVPSIVVVPTARADPISWLELHGRAMGVVASNTAHKIVVGTNTAKPITRNPRLKQWSPRLTTTATHL